MTPCFGSINLLEWLKKLRKKSLLTRLQVYYKMIKYRNSQTEEMHRAGLRKGRGLPNPLQAHHSPQISMCLLSEPQPSGFLLRLHHIGKVD